MKMIGQIQRIIVAAFFLLLLLPLMGFFGTEINWEDVFLNGRRLGLLENSIVLGGLSAVLCMLIGLLAAMKIHNGRLRNSSKRWFFLLLAPVPYYIYALMWMYLVRMLGQFDRRIMSTAMTGLLPSVFVNVMSFLPMVVGLCLVALEHHDASLEEMGAVYADGNQVFRKIVFPAIRPVVFASGALVFVLSVTDFSVPSLFQYQTFTLEIFSEYSRGGNLGEIAVLSAPLVLIVLIVIFLMEKGLRTIPVRQKHSGNKGLVLNGIQDKAGRIAVGMCILQVTVPLIVFILQIKDWSDLLDSLLLCSEELMVSLLIALISAVIAIGLSGPTAVWLQKKNRFWWIVAILPMAVPSSLIGMGLLSAVNGSIIHDISRTALFPALGCAVKYMPFAVIIFSARARRVHREELDVALVYTDGGWNYFWKILVPVYRPAIIGAGALVFLLTLGEEGIGLILMPPGYETLAVKVYNYLHYGASELVSGFCLITILVTAAILLTVLKQIGRK